MNLIRNSYVNEHDKIIIYVFLLKYDYMFSCINNYLNLNVK